MLEKIIQIIASRSGVPTSALTEETNILDLDIDSLDIINMIMDVEYSFNVRFEDDEIIEIRTAKDIEETILKKFK